MEGVEGPMGNVPQVVARKRHVLAPLTCLQHLVDSEVLLKKKTERYHEATELEGQEQTVLYPTAGARRKHGSSIPPSFYALR